MRALQILSNRQRKTLEAVVEIASEPSRGCGSAELARLLGMSRESIYQLLLPVVREGLLIGDRGRNGGYRAAPGTAEKALSTLLGLPSPIEPGEGGPEWLVRIERLAGEQLLHVFDSITVGDLASNLKATRSAPTWEI